MLRYMIIFLAAQAALSIDITQLTVPKLIEDGKKGPFDLECQYRCGEGDENLVVKWFFNNSTTPFYQWIANLGTEPVIQGLFETKLTYEKKLLADACNKYTYHLRIVEPTVSMSGKYRCEVQTFDGQDTAEANMIVYSPPKEFTLTVSERETGELDVVCEVVGVYPLPDMKLYYMVGASTEKRQLDDPLQNETLMDDDQVYRVLLSTVSNITSIVADQQLTFECGMAFKEVKYQRFQRTKFTPKFRPALDGTLQSSGSAEGTNAKGAAASADIIGRSMYILYLAITILITQHW